MQWRETYLQVGRIARGLSSLDGVSARWAYSVGDSAALSIWEAVLCEGSQRAGVYLLTQFVRSYPCKVDQTIASCR